MVPSISPCIALKNIIARVGGFNGISKPAVGRRREARRGFIRNHKFIFGHRLDRCLSPDLSLALENFSNALSRCFKSAGCFPACKSSLTSTTKPYLSLLMSSGHVIVNCTYNAHLSQIIILKVCAKICHNNQNICHVRCQVVFTFLRVKTIDSEL